MFVKSVDKLVYTAEITKLDSLEILLVSKV